MANKILEIEFSTDNYMRLSNIAWMLLLMKKIDTGYDKEFIVDWLSTKGYNEEVLEEAIAIRNYDRDIIKQYAFENNVNPNWLLEYKEIAPEEYHYLVKQTL